MTETESNGSPSSNTPEVTEWSLSNLGARIRAIRRGQGLSLSELAKFAGYSEGYMSGVETSAAVPSISALSVIAAVLDVDVSAFFPPQVEPQVKVHRAKSPHNLRLAESSAESYSLISSRLDNPSYTALRHEFTDIDSSATYRYVGERFMLILKGDLMLSFQSKEFHMKVGDCVHYSSHPEHSLKMIEHCLSAEILWIVTPALVR